LSYNSLLHLAIQVLAGTRFAQSRALGRKESDAFTVPLCRREIHRCGDEAARQGQGRVGLASIWFAVQRELRSSKGPGRMQMNTQYVSAGLLEALGSRARRVLNICFWVWGLAGLVGNAFNLLGPSIYPLAALLYWIGGMLLFGLGALQANSNYDFKRPVE
jgi:hypothetical protein